MNANKVIEIEGIRLNDAAISEIRYLQDANEYPRKYISDALEIIHDYWENLSSTGNEKNMLSIVFGLIGIEKTLETLNVGKEVRNATV